MLLVLLWYRQMTNDVIKLFFQPCIQSHFWILKTAARHEESFLHAFLHCQSIAWSWVQVAAFLDLSHL